MLEFLESLPIAQPVTRVERGPGVNVDGAFLGAALISMLSGENVPVRTTEIGIRGRGSLVLDDTAFDELLSSMIMVRHMRDVLDADAPTGA